MRIVHSSFLDNGILSPNSKGQTQKYIGYGSRYDKFMAKCHY